MSTPRGAWARAWCRVDLGGGTLDIWPLGLLHPGPTVNVAIDVPVRVELRRRRSGWSVRQQGVHRQAARSEDLLGDPTTALVGLVVSVLRLPPVDVELSSASPRGGGLGASSALTVALLVAGRMLTGQPETPPSAVAILARDLEAQLMELPTGTQDHFPALLGGALAIEHVPGGPLVRRLAVDFERLGEALVTVYSGVSHFSAANNWQVIRRRLDGDREVRARFDAIAEIAGRLPQALESGDLAAAGRLLAAEWQERRQLAPQVSSRVVDELLTAATGAGAWGGKVCGAGGGGCLAILTDPARRPEVERVLVAAGGELLHCRPVELPLECGQIADS